MTWTATQADEPIAWRTGSAFQQQLAGSVGFEWKSNPLRPALTNLARNQQVSIWLDRRVDPGQLMDVAVENQSLDAALQYVAESVGCSVSVLDSVIYVGPRDTASKLATLAALRREEVRKLPAAARSRYERRLAWKWEELTTPKDLLAELAREVDARLYEPERLPHDLWPAGDYPLLPLSDRLTLLLAGFEMTYELARDGTAIRPAPIPAEVSIQREHSLPNGNSAILDRLRADISDAQIERTGNKLTVRSTVETHDQIARLLRGEPIRKSPPARGGTKVYELNAPNQPAGAIIKMIAENEKLTVLATPDVLEKLNNQRVTVNVRSVTMPELLEQTLRPLGLTYRLNGSSLELLPSTE